MDMHLIAASNSTEESVALPTIMGTLSLAGYTYASLLVVFNLKFRNLRFIKMTSPRINIITVFGAVLMYSFSLMPVLKTETLYSTQLKHQVQYWLLVVGFTLLMGSMLVKGWRVHQLFTYQRKKTKLIKDGNLVAGILALLVLDVSFMLGWQLSDPVTCNSLSLCASEHHSMWLLVLSLYKQMFILLCCFMGWSIRHVTFPALDEGKSLLLTAATSLLSISSISAVAALYTDSYTVIEYMAAMLCWLTATVALSAAFVHKIIVICSTRGNEPYMTSASKYIKQPMSNNVGDELLKVLGENHYLKQQLDEKDTMLNHLKKLVPHNMHHEVDNYHPMSEGSSSLHNKSSTNVKLHAKLHIIQLLGPCCAVNSAEPTLPTSPEPYHKQEVNNSPYPAAPPAALQDHCATLPAMGSPMHTRAIHSINGDSPRSYTVDYGRVANLDLICSIADTYDLPSDSDTYSYISNCLMQRSYDSTVESRSRRLRRSQGSLCDTKFSPNNETTANRQHKPRHRSRSQSASRKTKYKCGSNISGTVMTDSNCSTVIL